MLQIIIQVMPLSIQLIAKGNMLLYNIREGINTVNNSNVPLI